MGDRVEGATLAHVRQHDAQICLALGKGPDRQALRQEPLRATKLALVQWIGGEWWGNRYISVKVVQCAAKATIRSQKNGEISLRVWLSVLGFRLRKCIEK